MVRDRLAANPDHLEVRKWAERADRAYSKEPPGARSSEVTIDDVNGVTATWIDAKGARKDRVILYLHGGAFIAETPAIHSALVARIGAQARARALMPNYRLAPEFPWPAALDDCIAAYRFLLDNGFDATDIALVGDSAGGTLVLGLMLRARDGATGPKLGADRLDCCHRFDRAFHATCLALPRAGAARGDGAIRDRAPCAGLGHAGPAGNAGAWLRRRRPRGLAWHGNAARVR